MTSRARAVRIAIEAALLPIEERCIVLDALLAIGGEFEAALAAHRTEPFARGLADVVADIDRGLALQFDEEDLVARLAAKLPPRSARDFLDQRDGLIRYIVDGFAPSDARSVSSRAAWLRGRFDRLITGADWKRDRRAVVCPYSEETLRGQLWRLAQFGALPSDRHLRGILTEQ